MSYLDRLIERHFDSDAPAMQPRLASRFEEAHRAAPEPPLLTATHVGTDRHAPQSSAALPSQSHQDPHSAQPVTAPRETFHYDTPSSVDASWERRLSLAEASLRGVSDGTVAEQFDPPAAIVDEAWQQQLAHAEQRLSSLAAQRIGLPEDTPATGPNTSLERRLDQAELRMDTFTANLTRSVPPDASTAGGKDFQTQLGHRQVKAAEFGIAPSTRAESIRENLTPAEDAASPSTAMDSMPVHEVLHVHSHQSYVNHLWKSNDAIGGQGSSPVLLLEPMVSQRQHSAPQSSDISPLARSRSQTDSAQPPARYQASPPPRIEVETLPRAAREPATVHVSIGRIEIRSKVPKPQAKRGNQLRTQPRIMTLDDYARLHKGGA